MTTTLTPRLGLPQSDASTDLWPGRTGFNDIFGDLDDLVAMDVQVDALGDRPAAGKRGRFCWVEDDGTLWRDDGTSWFQVFAQGARLNDLAAPDGAVAMGAQKITGLANGSAAQDAVTKSQLDAVSAAIAATKLSAFAAPDANVSMAGFKITSLLAGTASTDAVNKTQLDAVLAAIAATKLSAFAAPDASVSLGSQKITNLLAGTAAADAVNKTQLDAVNAAIATTIAATKLSALANPDASVNLNSQKIINLLDGTAAQDAISKAQLDAHAADTSTHGVTSDIVGRTETQTLTNKTLTSPTLTTPSVDGYVPGAYADYVPTITGVTATVSVARFTRTGAKRISGYVLFSLTGAPTGFVTCSLPVAARAALARLAIGAATIKATGIVSDSVVVIDGDATFVYIVKGDDFMKNGQGWVSGNAVGLSFDYEAA